MKINKIYLSLMIISTLLYSNENTGLELGQNSNAIGIGSISTGRNSLAIGTNSVATGGNETKESIENKLNENRLRLEEIRNKETEISNLTKEINDLKIKERETIEAGIRVKELEKSKENAKKEWLRLKEEYDTEVSNSAEFFRVHQAKLDDLNSRLSALSRIQNIDVSSENGLNEAATRFKTIVEDGTTLNLSNDFYKDYISSYYRALGDLRENKIIGLRLSHINSHSNRGFWEQKDKKYVKDWNSYSNLYNIDRISLFSYYFDTNYVNFDYTYNEDKVYDDNSDRTISNLKPTKINIETDILSQEKYDYWKNNKERIKNKYITEISKISDGMNVLDDNAKLYVDWLYNKKFESLDYLYEIAYNQGKYEETHNNTYLDEKQKFLKKYNELQSNWTKLSKEKIIELVGINGFYKRNIDNSFGLNYYLENKEDDWRKENITDIETKNRITTNKLSKELEIALGINKSAILEREKAIAKMLELSEQAKRNYEGLNPTERDLILSREYVRVAEILKSKGDLLASDIERLRILKEQLTLYDLTNIGENAIAIGNNTISSGTNSISLGANNISTSTNTISIGYNNLSTLENSISLGSNNINNSKDSLALGKNNILYGNNNHIIGNSNKIGTNDSVSENVYVLGSNITANNVNNAVVLGDNSKAITNAVSVGNIGSERQIKNVKDGTDNTDAVTVAQLNNAISGIVIHNFDNATVNSKANKDLSNVTKESIVNKASENANIDIPTNSLVTDTLVKEKLDTKANKNGSNIDKNNFIEKLSSGASFENTTGALVKDSDVKTYVESKINNETLSNTLTKGTITSETLNVSGNGKVLGEDIHIELKDDVKAKLDNALSKTEASDTYASKIELDKKANKDMSNVEKGNILSNSLSINGEGQILGNDIKIELKDKSISLRHLGDDILEKIQNRVSENSLNIDSYSKNDIDLKSKISDSGVASAIALSNTFNSKNSDNYVITASTGYYNKNWALGLGFSGMNNSLGYKVGITYNSSNNIGIGASLAYSFGEEKKFVEDKFVKELKDKIVETENMLEELKDKNKKFEENLSNIKNNYIYTLNGYDIDIYMLTEFQKSNLIYIYDTIEDNSNIYITGYADYTGDDKYNVELALNRALEVANFLKELGLDESRIQKISGSGYNNAINSNITEEGKFKNRRVEIEIR